MGSSLVKYLFSLELCPSRFLHAGAARPSRVKKKTMVWLAAAGAKPLSAGTQAEDTGATAGRVAIGQARATAGGPLGV